jgi:hypothetical protein
MAIVNSVAARAYVNGHDISGDLNSIEPSPTTQVQDVTTFGAGVTGKSYAAVMHDDSFAHSGFYSDDMVNGIEAILGPLKGTTALVTLWPAGDTAGKRGYGGNAALLDTGGQSSKVGSVVAVQHGYKVSGGADLAVSLEAKQQITGTGSAQVTTAVDNGALSANGGYAYFQVFAADATPGITNFKLEHSADNSSWATLATGTLTGQGAERIAVVGTINRYVRRTITATSGKHVTLQTAVSRS